MKNRSQQDEAPRRARTWWQHCAPDERAYWSRQANSRQPIDAWQMYRQALISPPGKLLTTDMPCPECGHPSTEALEFPDGRAVHCPQCGYRNLDCGPDT